MMDIDDLKELLINTGAFAMVLLVALTVVLTPIAYLDGRVKSKLLQQNGISMPWYEATFVPDTAFISGALHITNDDK